MTSSRIDSSGEAGPNVFTVGVETKAAKFSFDCRDGETLLTAGLAAGYDLPYECSTGTCATCHARVVSGSVDPGWPEAPGYAKLKIDKGDVLMCQARPSSDCAIRVRSTAAQHDAPTPLNLHRTGRVDVVKRLTPDVLHFELVLSEPMSFAAGQFVGLKHADVTGVRAYSMVNFDEDTERLSFVVKRKPDGVLSDALFDGDIEETEFDVVGPLGRATFRPHEKRDFICIAGGSGIAGMMSMLHHAHQIGHFKDHKAHVFFGVRTLADAFYLAEFAELLAAADGGLKIIVAVSDEKQMPERHHEFPDIRLTTGLVHDAASAAMQGLWNGAITFVAGPQPMVDATIKMLITEARMKPGDIRFDKFS